MPLVKLIVTGKIELLTPAIIGSGESEGSDIDVIKDEDGNPFIPATSFIGVLREKIKPDDVSETDLEDFWGARDSSNPAQIKQSSIICQDLMAEKCELAIRDGVSIDNKKGIAKDKAKFDYELIEKGSIFKLFMEINLDGKNDSLKKKMLVTIVNLLTCGQISIGAKTTNGFGKICLKDKKIYNFDFTKKQDAINWFRYLNNDNVFPAEASLNEAPFNIRKKQFIIDATFTVKNSLIVRSYNIDPYMPDTENIKSGGVYVLPGTSTKGAIRARAERIINTLNKDIEMINELFGTVDAKNKQARKGRVFISEAVLKEFPSEIQTRIKIDRFTGGTIESALLETKPLFRGENDAFFNLKITIDNYRDCEAGLLLLILKDLWTGDLPVGGEKSIGRGVLQGEEAKISFEGKTIAINNLQNLSSEDREVLQNFVKAFVNSGGNT